ADHHDALPDRLVVVRAALDVRRQLLRRVHAADLHVAPERDRADAVLGLALADLGDQRREEQREALHAHPPRLRGPAVAELVQDDQRGKAEEGQDPGHARTPISSPASWRASESTTYRVSKLCTRWEPSSSSTPSITAGMPRNDSRPLRNACTAISLAALSA